MAALYPVTDSTTLIYKPASNTSCRYECLLQKMWSWLYLQVPHLALLGRTPISGHRPAKIIHKIFFKKNCTLRLDVKIPTKHRILYLPSLNRSQATACKYRYFPTSKSQEQSLCSLSTCLFWAGLVVINRNRWNRWIPTTNLPYDE